MMYKFFTGVIFLFLACTCNSAQADENGDLSVKKIDASLLKDANAVVRRYETIISVNAIDEVRCTEHYAITILNEKGSRYGILREYYDQLISIKYVRGWLYDEDGNEVATMKKSEVMDIGISDQYFFNDSRLKSFSFNRVTYPYTVVYEIERKTAYTFFIPPWIPQPGYDCALETAQVTVNFPNNDRFRYKTFHMDTASRNVTKSIEQQNLFLSVKNIAAIGHVDELAPDDNFPFATLIVAVDSCGLQDYQGKMDTWNDYAKFFYEINAGRAELPPATKSLVHKLADTCNTELGKISILYQYLKQNTRYVNISLGIGGWQTHDAQFVAEKGYGDCKALSNYMMALLKEAGITSYLALVYAGEQQTRTMIPDFPYNMFNHMILAVPLKNDTMWLECTSKDLPAGYMSGFTMDRKALIITPQGGLAANTPHFANDENLLTRKAICQLNNKDELTAGLECSYKGCWWDHEAPMIKNESKSRIERYFNSKYAIPTYTVTDIRVEDNNTAASPVLREKIALTGNGCASRSGAYLFISAAIFRTPADMPYAPPGGRKGPFQITHGCRVTDSVTLTVEQACDMENKPKDIEMNFPFGTFRAHVAFEQEHSLTVTTFYDQKKGIYPAAQYADYINFCKTINSFYSQSKIMLSVKK